MASIPYQASEHVTSTQLSQALCEAVVRLWGLLPPDVQHHLFEEATSHKFKPTKRGASFGPSWSTHWFKIQLTVPEDMRDKERLEFHWDANNEGMVWTEDGRPLQGLTGGGERIEPVAP